MNTKSFFLIITTFLFLLTSCKEPDSWEEPVHDYFDKYTNTAAIEKHEIPCKTVKDSSNTLCISSDGDKTLNFYLRNPRKYNLDPLTFTSDDERISIEQDSSDKSIVRITYPEDYLIEQDGTGSNIGGTIHIAEEETQRSFDDYSFSLKCNTPPPAIKGACVQIADGKYWVCLYLPTTQLATTRHSHEEHTLYIGNTGIPLGTAASLLSSANTQRPAGLTELPGGNLFNDTAPSGYSPFYYQTDHADSGDANWKIRLVDAGGLSSGQALATTRINPVHLTLPGSGTMALDAEGPDPFLYLPLEFDQNVNVEDISFEYSVDDIVEAEPEDDILRISASHAGVTNMTVTTILESGETVKCTKQIRVIGLSLPGGDNNETMFVGGTDYTPSATAEGFPSTPTCTWTSSDTNVATVDSSGKVVAKNPGTATITVSASYNGVRTQAQKTVKVYKCTLTGDNYGFAGNANTFQLSTSLVSPDDESPTATYTWSSSETDVATVSSGANTSTVTPKAGGSTTASVQVTIGGKSITLTKTLSIYDIVLTGNPLMKLSDGAKTFSASVKAGTTAYSGSSISYTWDSSNISTASVTSGSANSTITPQAAGSSEITITAHVESKAITKKQNLYVISVTGRNEFIVGEASRALTVTPETGPTYSWTFTSGSNNYATLNSSTGAITAKANGTRDYKLTASLGSDSLDITGSISVTAVTLQKDGETTNTTPDITVNELIQLYPYNVNFSSSGWSITSLTPHSESDKLGFTPPNNNNVYIGANASEGPYYADAQFTKGDVTVTVENFLKVSVASNFNVSCLRLSNYMDSLDPDDYSQTNPFKPPLNSLNITDTDSAYLITAIKTHPEILIDLTGITIPYCNTGYGGQGTFQNCVSIVKPPILGGNPTNLSNCFSGCTNLTVAPTIPSTVTNMAGIFQGCTSLTTPPSIPSGVTTLQSAFDSCTNLTSAPNIPNTVTNINSCFADCTKLVTGPTIPASVSLMGSCFSGCTSLKTVTIKYDGSVSGSTGRTLTTYSNTFKDCTSITTVTYNTTTSGIATAETNMIINADNNSSVSGKITVTH